MSGLLTTIFKHIGFTCTTCLTTALLTGMLNSLTMDKSQSYQQLNYVKKITAWHTGGEQKCNTVIKNWRCA